MQMNDKPAVLHRIEDQVSILTLNRDERHNATDRPMIDLFNALMRQAILEDASRAILVQAEGRSFGAGVDTTWLGGGGANFALVSRSQSSKFEQMSSQKPIVAAVQGYAIGGGAERALRADIRVFADDVQLSLPEIHHGVMTDGGGSAITAAIAGASRAKYLLMTGDRINAQRCYEWGMCDFVVPRAELHEFAFNIARKIAAQPPVHLAVAKQLCDSIDGPSIRRGIEEERIAIMAVRGMADAAEARAARKERRPGVFTGL
jgi:enoyl-CoA hydratase/carnithine racemase